jgi:hypothetical protein
MFLVGNKVSGLFFICFLFILLYLQWTRKKKEKHTHNKAAVLLTIFIFVYIGFLTFSISFIDAYTPLDYRILYPVYIFGILFILLITSDVIQLNHTSTGSKAKFAIVFLFIPLFIASKAIALPSFVNHFIDHGQGYLSKGWRESHTLNLVKTFPVGVIYTNAEDILDVYFNRETHFIPKMFNPTSKLENSDYQAEIAIIRNHLIKKGGLIVYIHQFAYRSYFPKIDRLYADIGLAGSIYEAKDGFIILFSTPSKD